MELNYEYNSYPSAVPTVSSKISDDNLFYSMEMFEIDMISLDCHLVQACEIYFHLTECLSCLRDTIKGNSIIEHCYPLNHG